MVMRGSQGKLPLAIANARHLVGNMFAPAYPVAMPDVAAVTRPRLRPTSSGPSWGPKTCA